MFSILDELRSIQEQIGLKLKLDPYFSGIRINSIGQEYFNIELESPTWSSLEYIQLEKFAKKFKTIRIERNGWKRVAVYPLHK